MRRYINLIYSLILIVDGRVHLCCKITASFHYILTMLFVNIKQISTIYTFFFFFFDLVSFSVTPLLCFLPTESEGTLPLEVDSNLHSLTQHLYGPVDLTRSHCLPVLRPLVYCTDPVFFFRPHRLHVTRSFSQGPLFQSLFLFFCPI